MISKITDALNPIKQVGEVVQSIIQTFKLPPEQQRELEVAAAQAQLEIERARIAAIRELEVLYVKDQADLRKQIRFELASDDPFVRRARPAWLWALLLIYSLNYGGSAVANWFIEMEPVPFPNEVHLLVAVLVGGYGLLRTIEKGQNDK